MKRLSKKRNKRSVGKVLTAALIGSAVGATVGLLTAPVSGRELRRRIRRRAMDPRAAQERAKTAAGNVETRARELAAEMNQNVDNIKQPVGHRKKAVIVE